MFLEFNSLYFMGFTDSLDKDSHAMECNILSRPFSESQDVCQIASSNEADDHYYSQKNQRDSEFRRNEKQEIEKGCRSIETYESSLTVKLPKAREVKRDDEEEEEEEGCSTPTSADHKIPQVCPPTPTKLKPIPSANSRSSRKRALLDLSNEVGSLFPPVLQADFGNKIKKIRKE